MTSNATHPAPQDRQGQHGPSLQSEGTDDHITLRFHISCRRCKHLHRNRTWRVPKDTSSHVRFCCEVCKTPLAGINGTSTQNTLASEESFVFFPDGIPRRRYLGNHRPRFPSIGASLLRLQSSTASLSETQTNLAGNQAHTRSNPRLARLRRAPPTKDDSVRFDEGISKAGSQIERAETCPPGTKISLLRESVHQLSQRIFGGTRLVPIRRLKARMHHKRPQQPKGDTSIRGESSTDSSNEPKLEQSSGPRSRSSIPVIGTAEVRKRSSNQPQNGLSKAATRSAQRQDEEDMSQLALLRRVKTAQKVLIEQRCQCGPHCDCAQRSSTMCNARRTSLAFDPSQVPENELYQHAAANEGNGNVDLRWRRRSGLLSCVGQHLQEETVQRAQRRRSTGSSSSGVQYSCSSCMSHEHLDGSSRRSSGSPVRRPLNPTPHVSRPALGSRNSFNVVSLPPNRDQAVRDPRSFGSVPVSVSTEALIRHHEADDTVAGTGHVEADANSRQNVVSGE